MIDLYPVMTAYIRAVIIRKVSHSMLQCRHSASPEIKSASSNIIDSLGADVLGIYCLGECLYQNLCQSNK